MSRSAGCMAKPIVGGGGPPVALRAPSGLPPNRPRRRSPLEPPHRECYRSSRSNREGRTDYAPENQRLLESCGLLRLSLGGWLQDLLRPQPQGTIIAALERGCELRGVKKPPSVWRTGLVQTRETDLHGRARTNTDDRDSRDDRDGGGTLVDQRFGVPPGGGSMGVSWRRWCWVIGATPPARGEVARSA